MRMRSPILMRHPEDSAKPDAESQRNSLVVRNNKMQQGLLAKASIYASNASKSQSATSHFSRIVRATRDPIVWGDASNRYVSNKRSEGICNDGENTENFEETKKTNVPHSLRQVTFQDKKCQESQRYQASNEPTELLIAENDAPYTLQNPIHDPNRTNESDEMIGLDLHAVTTNGDVSDSSSVNTDCHQRDLSFDSTQQLRSGFFRSIKRQYSPILTPKRTESLEESGNITEKSAEGKDCDENTSCQDEQCEGYSMSILARQKLDQLRKIGTKQVDVPTGLQWIRLELHEMREQDKSLFLQLIKLHSTIKDLRADLNGHDDFDSYDDLHNAASLWWPRRGHSFNTLPDFSSSDGAQLFRGGKSKTALRRGFSLNYPPAAHRAAFKPEISLRESSVPSPSDSSEPSISALSVTAT